MEELEMFRFAKELVTENGGNNRAFETDGWVMISSKRFMELIEKEEILANLQANEIPI
jgi:hypothetical protein